MTYEEGLKGTYEYNPTTGEITLSGEVKGWVCANGYTYVTTKFKTKVLAHRLAWLLHYGEWPEGDVDHIDRNKSNNRIDNLRDVSRSQNLLNMDTPLLKGITWDRSRNKWRSRTGRNGTMKRFSTFCEAYKYRKETLKELVDEV